MGAWILGVHRGVDEREPGGIPLGGVIAVDVTVANRGDWPPEVVVILRVEYGDERIVDRLRGDGKQAGVLRGLSPRRGGDRPHHRKVDQGPDVGPEAGDVRLFRTPLCAVLGAEGLDLVVIARPQGTGETGGWAGA